MVSGNELLDAITSSEQQQQAPQTDCLLCQKPLLTDDVIVSMPCRHTFCPSCVEEWRTQENISSKKLCPNCRQTIPPSKESLASLQLHRMKLEKLLTDLSAAAGEEDGAGLEVPQLPGEPGFEQSIFSGLFSREEIDQFRQLPTEKQQPFLKTYYELLAAQTKQDIDVFEAQYGDIDELLLDSNNNNVNGETIVLPSEIFIAAMENDMVQVETYLSVESENDSALFQKRLNAKAPDFTGGSLLLAAAFGGHVQVLQRLLQLGADVDQQDNVGASALFHACMNTSTNDNAVTISKILLQWGSHISPNLREFVSQQNTHDELASLVKTSMGGRRCEIVGLKSRSELNGKMGIVGRYFGKEDRYAIMVDDTTKEQIKVRSVNLFRIDRTPKNSSPNQ
jgi:ankyrin repeat protein